MTNLSYILKPKYACTCSSQVVTEHSKIYLHMRSYIYTVWTLKAGLQYTQVNVLRCLNCKHGVKAWTQRNTTDELVYTIYRVISFGENFQMSGNL